MFKLIISFIITLTYLNGYSQSDSLYFSISSYHIDRLYRKDIIAIKNTKRSLDLLFYKENFYMFYGLPKKLVKKKYRNQKIIQWAFSGKPKKLEKNWTDSYIYDAQGRLIEYEYSGCLICSQFPWGFKLVYDDNNIIEYQKYQLSQIPVISEGKLKINFEPNEKTKEHIYLKYDSKQNIILLEKYEYNNLTNKIQLIKNK